MDKTTEPSRTSSGLVPTRPRDTTTKLKWNMVLQHTTNNNSGSSLSRSTSKQQLVDSRTPSPLLSPRDNGTQPTLPTEQVLSSTADKKSSVDSSSSSSSKSLNTVDSLRSSLGFDWKVIGAPSGGSEQPPPGHSRERALSLLERVSGAHLTDEYDEQQQAHPPMAAPASARTTRGYSVFSPFNPDYEYQQPVRDDSSFGFPHEDHYRSSLPSSRASSPAVQPQTMYPFYSPQPTQHHYGNYQQQMPPPYMTESMRRQSLMDSQLMMMNTAAMNDYHHQQQQQPYNPRHRPSLSHSYTHNPRTTPSPPMAVMMEQQRQQYHNRRSSVPHRSGSTMGIESEMAQMGLYETSYYEPNYQHYQSPPMSSPPQSYHYEYAPPQQQQQQQQQQPQEPLQLSSYRGPMYAVQFKAGRTEVFYVVEGSNVGKLCIGDWVIVEADRGEDLGKITSTISIDRLKHLIALSADSSHPDDLDKLAEQVEPVLAPILYAKEIVPKPIHRIAAPTDLKLLQAKAQEEAIAMVRCQSRIRQKRLPMEVVDAEYQWDRNKLTFYFQSDKRIDFRELVRDLFRIYKTRIWMCAVDKIRLAALAETRKSIDMEAVHAAAMAADAAFGPE